MERPPSRPYGLTSSRLPIFANFRGLWFGRDGNRNAGTLFEPHVVAIFVS